MSQTTEINLIKQKLSYLSHRETHVGAYATSTMRPLCNVCERYLKQINNLESKSQERK